MKASGDIAILGSDPITQKQIIEGALKRFTHELNSHLDIFPGEIQIMVRHIYEHLFEETLTVEKVKEACRLKNHNVTTKFRQTIGMGTREYIVSQRLKAAAYILRNTKVNIYLLASAIGYTEETFSRLFRRKYGCTPLQYYNRRFKRNGQEE